MDQLNTFLKYCFTPKKSIGHLAIPYGLVKHLSENDRESIAEVILFVNYFYLTIIQYSGYYYSLYESRYHYG